MLVLASLVINPGFRDNQLGNDQNIQGSTVNPPRLYVEMRQTLKIRPKKYVFCNVFPLAFKIVYTLIQVNLNEKVYTHQ